MPGSSRGAPRVINHNELGNSQYTNPILFPNNTGTMQNQHALNKSATIADDSGRAQRTPPCDNAGERMCTDQ
jgi:hypothetical protein